MVTTRRMQDLTVQDHTITVPLVWDQQADARTIEVTASVISREDGERLPYLVYLQGGPGHEAPVAFHAAVTDSGSEATIAPPTSSSI